MRRIHLLAILLLMTITLSASPVARKKALQKAQTFALKYRSAATASLKMAYSTDPAEGESGVYVFNIGQNEGFVVVSDDEADDVLGYSDTGSFDAQRMPENLRAWLALCAEEATLTAKATNVGIQEGTGAKKAKGVVKHPTDVIAPLLTSKWGQWEPFNSQCPFIGDAQCPTGCTATALAQVMRYHRHAAGSLAIPAYKTRTTNLNVPALPATTFDWDKMPDELTVDSNPDEIKEVAKLMRYCGQATSMNYNTSGSGAYTYYIPERLPLYFGYPNTVHYEYREAYDETAWDELLVAELLNRQPVIYTAYTNLNQGHTFVCDGYDGNGYYHINWGWVGTGNGFYRIDAAHAKGEGLNPNIKNYHLSGSQTALVGIKPAGSDTYTAPTELLRAFSRPSLAKGRQYTRSTTDAPFENIGITQSFFNTANAVKTLFYGYALFDDEGTLVTTLKSTSAKWIVGEKKELEATGLTVGGGILKGNYTIKAVYKTSSSADWKPMAGTDKNYIDVSIDDCNMTLTPVPQADFTVEHIGMEGRYLQITYDNPFTEFYGNIYLRKRDAKTGSIVDVSSDVMVSSPQTSDLFELYIPETETFDLENDRFFLSVDKYADQYFYSNEPADTFDIAKNVEIINRGEDGTTIVGDRVMCRMTLRNEGKADFHDAIVVTLIDDRRNLTEMWRDTVTIAAGDSLSRYMEIALTDFDCKYGIRMAHHNGAYSWTADTAGMYSVAKGAIYWTKDGSIKTQVAARNFQVPEEALAIILGNAYTTNVLPNANPNTIYMLDKTLPKGLVGKNYVNASYKGNKLTLIDGYDYFIPRQMQFGGKVTYTRELKDSDSLAWSTLTLPFKPTELYADDDAIAWKQDADDEEGLLWLMGIAEIQDSIIVTHYAEEMEADTPYLIAHDQRLVGKKLTFSASSCQLASMLEGEATSLVGDYVVHRTHATDSVGGGYHLVGNKMVLTGDSVAVNPFGFYLTTDSTDRPARLHIDIDCESDSTIVDPTPEAIKGDANADGMVDVVDVMLTVNHILGIHLPIFIMENADMNGDGVIDVADTMKIIGIILGTDKEQPIYVPEDQPGKE